MACVFAETHRTIGLKEWALKQTNSNNDKTINQDIMKTQGEIQFLTNQLNCVTITMLQGGQEKVDSSYGK